MGISYSVASVMANSVVYQSSCTISLGTSTGNTKTGRDHLSTDIGLGTLERNLPKGKIRWPPPAHLFLVAPKVTQPLVPRVVQANLAEHSELFRANLVDAMEKAIQKDKKQVGKVMMQVYPEKKIVQALPAEPALMSEIVNPPLA